MTKNLRGAKKSAKYLRGAKKTADPEKILQVGTQPNKCPAPYHLQPSKSFLFFSFIFILGLGLINGRGGGVSILLKVVSVPEVKEGLIRVY